LLVVAYVVVVVDVVFSWRLQLTAVWLAFLQPWKGMVFNPPTQGEIPANTFIVKHLKFYTTMMQHFLRAAQHLNFGTQEGIDTLDSVWLA